MQQHSLDHFVRFARRALGKFGLEDLFGTDAAPLFVWPPGPTNNNVSILQREELSNDLFVFLSDTA